MKSKFMSAAKWMLILLLPALFFSCRKDKWENSPYTEKQINLTGFTRVYAGSYFNVIITKGPAFQVTAKGPVNDVNDIEFRLTNTNNNTLDIQYRHYVRNRPPVDIVITMPLLSTFSLSGACNGVVNGFQDEPHVIRTILSGASTCVMNGTGMNANVEVSGGSQLTLNGSTAKLYGNISGGARLHAYGLTATEVDISTSGGSTAYVKVQNILYASASGGSRIYYKGNPAEKNIETSGGSQVIQE